MIPHSIKSQGMKITINWLDWLILLNIFFIGSYLDLNPTLLRDLIGL